MKVQNYEIKADTLFGGVGIIKELGDYAGRYSNEAFDALDIEDELEDVEWCDLMVADDGKIYAVAGDTEAHNTGNFYFKQVIAIKEKELTEAASEAAYEIYDTNPSMCITIGADEQGQIHVSRLHFKNEDVLRSLPFTVKIEGGYVEDKTEEEKLETINYYEDYITTRFDECKEESEIQILYI